MTTQAVSNEQVVQPAKVKPQGGSPEAVYGLGMIGAWVFYIGRATTWPERGIGLLKGLVWPAFLVYEVLKSLDKR